MRVATSPAMCLRRLCSYYSPCCRSCAPYRTGIGTFALEKRSRRRAARKKCRESTQLRRMQGFRARPEKWRSPSSRTTRGPRTNSKPSGQLLIESAPNEFADLYPSKILRIARLSLCPFVISQGKSFARICWILVNTFSVQQHRNFLAKLLLSSTRLRRSPARSIGTP
jgi:hypothetical protein